VGAATDGASMSDSTQDIVSQLTSLDGMAQVEALIQEKFTSSVPLLTDISSYLLTLGGKRIRPALTLLCAQAFGLQTPSTQLVEVASGIELIHMATLLHDDIIDKAELRRHKASPYRKFGLDTTLLAGDFLLTRAFSLCARLDRDIIDQTELACIALTEGETLELTELRQDSSRQRSIDVARMKTAALFSLAAFCGSHLAGASTEARESMRCFGEGMGIAFQILDDILDVTSETEVFGKPIGLDIRERKPSIVNVLWLESDSPLAKRCLLQDEAITSAELQLAIAELRSGSVLDEARKLAEEFSREALGHLNRAADLSPQASSEKISALAMLIDFALERAR
jgi:octaprenyl-diphosphate synthase